jgi:hypothetical protein
LHLLLDSIRTETVLPEAPDDTATKKSGSTEYSYSAIFVAALADLRLMSERADGSDDVHTPGISCDSPF